jgi:hypothetical protein
MIDESLGFSGPKRVHTGVATINREGEMVWTPPPARADAKVKKDE